MVACGFYAYAINKIGIVLQRLQHENNISNEILLQINRYMDNKNINVNL